MPRLPHGAIVDALRRLPEEELAAALGSKILPMVTLPGLRLYATFGEVAGAEARRQGLRVMAAGDSAAFLAAVREAHGGNLLRRATFDLAARFPLRSAINRFSGAQIGCLWLIGLLLAGCAALGPAGALATGLGLLGGLLFLAVIALRILALMAPARAPAAAPLPLADAELPVYTVLVPLFRETSVLGQLLEALNALEYPSEKLDIKLILEESDILMQRAVFGLRLPAQFDVLVVPSGQPQTKPRALNYGMQFARGELVTIYDAEDIPDPSQLREAATAFAALSPDTACLQAALTYYNAEENWLSRQFTVEYASLFRVMLPALAAHNLPFPLGGTSNHFRRAILQSFGGWDPFNVTEDADLGLRLARAGYETATLDSVTLEESVVGLGNWLKQRARWFKGFLQTWLVHTRQPIQYLLEVGPAAFWVTQVMTAGVFLSALLHPLCLAVVLWPLLALAETAAPADLMATILAALGLVVLVAGYAVSMMLGVEGLRRTGRGLWWFTIATMPVYWLLMSLAAWMALWQFAFAPSYWNKTQHGLSRHHRRRRADRQ